MTSCCNRLKELRARTMPTKKKVDQTVENGDEVKDLVTGLKGIVIGITEWLNGCARAGVQPQVLKDGKAVDPAWVDLSQLQVLAKGKVQPNPAIQTVKAKAKKELGGPRQDPGPRADPQR